MPITREILDMLDIGQKPISSNFSRFFTLKITKFAKDKFSHCAMGLDYSFQWLLTAPSHRIIALCVHPFSVRLILYVGGSFQRGSCPVG